jgi:hypothetical protein
VIPPRRQLHPVSAFAARRRTLAQDRQHVGIVWSDEPH